MCEERTLNTKTDRAQIKRNIDGGGEAPLEQASVVPPTPLPMIKS